MVRRLIAVSALAGLLLVAGHSLAQLPVTFQSPHTVRAPAAKLDESFARAVDAKINDAKIGSVEQLVRFILDVTAADLHFGLEHKTTLAFGAKEREGNCVEYAHLFATVFNRAAERKQIAARAYVVRSDARVLGRKLSDPALADHDWVLVVPKAAGAQRLFVDPTLYDFGLDWDISRSVSGDVRAP